jgi:hypothetical protein
LGQIKRVIGYCEKSLAIAREIGDRWLESYQLLRLGRALLASGSPSEARRHCTEALTLGIPQISYQVALAFAIVLLHQDDPNSESVFTDAISQCQDILDKASDLYHPRYALATALVGQAVCNLHWGEEGDRARLLAPALAEYKRALETCAALGVVCDALRDLELIRAAGIEGLEPVFELLKGAEAGNDD